MGASIELNHRSNNNIKFPLAITQQVDDSQLQAFKTALSSKVALIQGPPGTGKTFISTLITKVLLTNVSSPILVVCFSNHALDQFLSHLLSYTTSIVRIGGRCNDERLKPYMLSNYRTMNKKALFQINRQLDTITESISDLSSAFDSKRLISLQVLMKEFPEFMKKLVNDFISIMGIQKKRNLDKARGSIELIYKVWGGAVDVEKLLDLFVTTDNENYNDYWHLFDRFCSKYVNVKYPTYEEAVRQEQQKQQQMQQQQQQMQNNVVNINNINGDDEEEESENDEDEINENEEREAFEDFANQINNDKYKLPNQKEKLHINQFIYLYTKYNLFTIDIKTRKIMHEFIKTKIIDNTSIDERKLDYYNKALQKKKELEIMNTSEIIKTSRIVGMTTTGCAKYSTLLEQNINEQLNYIESSKDSEMKMQKNILYDKIKALSQLLEQSNQFVLMYEKEVKELKCRNAEVEYNLKMLTNSHMEFEMNVNYNNSTLQSEIEEKEQKYYAMVNEIKLKDIHIQSLEKLLNCNGIKYDQSLIIGNLLRNTKECKSIVPQYQEDESVESSFVRNEKHEQELKNLMSCFDEKNLKSSGNKDDNISDRKIDDDNNKINNNNKRIPGKLYSIKKK
jgi:hypothetical protein